ncbi:hypothetical protein [Streptomyces sp. NPDC003006]
MAAAEIATAEGRLTRYLGHGLPAEAAALWRLCGGVEHQYIEENEEEGESAPGRFSGRGAVHPGPGGGPAASRTAGVGDWTTMDGPVMSEPLPSVDGSRPGRPPPDVETLYHFHYQAE